MTNLANNLTRSAAEHPDRVALRLDEAALTYAQLDALTARVAGRLRELGLVQGDRVGLMLPNVLAFPVLYYGVLRAGGVVVPMNPLLKSREVEHYLGDSGAKLAFVWEDFRDEAVLGAADVGAAVVTITGQSLTDFGRWPTAEGIAERAYEDTGVILYTSGTTGSPKGAELTHGNLGTNAAVTRDLFGLDVDDVVMGCLPLFHAFGQTCAMNAGVLAGATLSLMQRFDPVRAVEIIERDGVTIFEGVPTMYIAFLQAASVAAGTSSLRLCVSGGAALPNEVLTSFKDVFGAQILEGYGLSETSPVASFNHQGNTKAGSIGHPVDGVEMRIVGEEGQEVPAGEIGEIAIRGHNIMRGYWQREDATAEAIRDGWFHTGDMGRRDDDGFFYVVDRKKEMIIRGGFNIYPREIEEVLYEHPAILEAAVVGVPHPTHGEEVGAAVTLRPGAAVTPEEIRHYMKQRVAAYKYPRHVWILDGLPKGPTGKILKREIAPPESVA